ncbi:MAG: chalcone isomerase family protein [Planctomycetes bacterium]|nr:chalcone isomerase family protein [Planctomycetota bacterium]
MRTRLQFFALSFSMLALASAAVGLERGRQEPIPVPGKAAATEQAPVQIKAPNLEESATDHKHPAWLYVGSGEKKARHDAVALAVRTKTWFKVKVYSFGLYLDLDAAAPLVKPFANKKWKDLMKDRNFDKALLNDKVGKTVRLKMARDVDADDMSEAFEDSLKPRIKTYNKKGTAEDRQASDAAIKKFQGYFTKECKENQVLVFTALPGGRLLTSIDGKQMPEIKNMALTWALFDIYLGDDPISENGKEAFVKALPTKLETRAAKKQ